MEIGRTKEGLDVWHWAWIIEEGHKEDSISEEGVMIMIEFGRSPKYQCNGKYTWKVIFTLSIAIKFQYEFVKSYKKKTCEHPLNHIQQKQKSCEDE